MADTFIGLNRGQTGRNIVSGAATQSTNMEFRFDNAANLTKKDIILALEAIEDYVLENPLTLDVT